MIIKIENLRLRTVVGIFEWEKKVKQDIVINIEIEFDGREAVEKDDIAFTVDYKSITKRIISEVEGREFNLIERIAGDVVSIILEDGRVSKATAKVDKPGALRFADTVSVIHSESK
ncbi:MAG: dihydroneopterin aldolase [Candidatus Dadabacteria bacterium RIFCSPHIGHO2_12_FULL_53_21]|nr:MAG: dihydroneopterin aldolase [Candidatus Dadabacteria bacterium RIFCSPHIGHO2_12_FULL_53_21]